MNLPFHRNCPRKNKNRFIIEMLLSSLINHPNIPVIQLAQNENDTAHSVIEKSKNGINIFHPYQWYSLTSTACKSFIVHEMAEEDFMSYETFMNSTCGYLIDNCPRDVDDLKKI